MANISAISIRLPLGLDKVEPIAMKSVLGNMCGHQNRMIETLHPITTTNNDALRSLASISERVELAAKPLMQSMEGLQKSLEVITAPIRKMEAIGTQRKASLKAEYVSNKTSGDSFSKHRKWHVYLPELKPLEMMTEGEFDKNIVVILSFVMPDINISHLECYVAERGISREEIRAISPWEIALYLDHLEDKFDDWEAHKKQCEAQTIEASPIPVSLISPKHSRPDQDHRFVIEGVAMVKAGEAASANHAAEILLKTYGWQAKGLEPNAKGKIIGATYDSTRTRLQKKIFRAL